MSSALTPAPHHPTRALSPSGAALTVVAPGLAYAPFAVFNLAVGSGLCAMSAEDTPYSNDRFWVFAWLFSFLAAAHVGVFLATRRSKLARWLAGRPRVVGLAFSANCLALMLLVLESLIGLECVKTSLPSWSYPDAIRIVRYYPRYNRLDRTPVASPVVFMGDSVTYGFGLQADQAIPSLLDERLGAERRVLNAALPDYNFEHYAYHARELLALRPRRVVLGVCLNDISRTSDRRLTAAPDDPRCRVQPVTRVNRLRWWLQAHCGLLNFRSFVGRVALRVGAIDQASANMTAITQIIDDTPLRERQTAVARQYLRDIVARFESNGIDFAVVVYPLREQYDSEWTRQWPGHRVLQEVVREICDDLDVPITDLLEPLADRAREEGLAPQDLFLDSEHLNALGCKLAADILE